jgi:hypothetical protein
MEFRVVLTTSLLAGRWQKVQVSFPDKRLADSIDAISESWCSSAALGLACGANFTSNQQAVYLCVLGDSID